MHAYWWICMHIDGYACISIDMHAYLKYGWISMHMHAYIHGDACISMDMHYRLKCMHINGYACISMDMHAYPYICMHIHCYIRYAHIWWQKNSLYQVPWIRSKHGGVNPCRPFDMFRQAERCLPIEANSSKCAIKWNLDEDTGRTKNRANSSAYQLIQVPSVANNHETKLTTA